MTHVSVDDSGNDLNTSIANDDTSTVSLSGGLSTESMRDRVNKRLADKSKPLSIRSAWDLKIRLQLMTHLEGSTASDDAIGASLRAAVWKAGSFNATYLRSVQAILESIGCPYPKEMKTFCFSRDAWKMCSSCPGGPHVYEAMLTDKCDKL